MMNWKLGIAGAALAALMVACPGPGGAENPNVKDFKVKATGPDAQASDNLTLPTVGGDAVLNWDVSGADKIVISDNNADVTDVGDVTTNATGNKTVTGIKKTTVFTLSATKGTNGKTEKTVTVTVPDGIKVTGKVLKFNGDAADGVRVQIGDATTQNNQQVTTSSDGVFEFERVQVPYTISAIPNIATEVPVSFKGTTLANPTIVLEPRTGQSESCSNAQEGIIRFRLPGSQVVDTAANQDALGYVYFVADGKAKQAIHEDTLKSNAVQVLNPGQRVGYIRVRHSQNACASEVKGALVYLERTNSGYKVSGVRQNVISRAGVTLPSDGDLAYEIPVGDRGNEPISGQVQLPSGYTSGFVFPILEIGNGATIVADPRDVKLFSTTTESRTFAFNLPRNLGTGVKYRIGVFAFGPQHDSWFHTNNIHPLPDGGLSNLIINTPQEFGAQEPGTSIPVADANRIKIDFDWEETKATTPTGQEAANLYYASWSKDAPSPEQCTSGGNELLWTAVSLDESNGVELTRFTLPVLPSPARLAAGTSAKPCKYTWASDNAVTVRQVGAETIDTELKTDEILDGRLVLKRHYIRSSGTSNIFNFFLISPVWVRNFNNPAESEIIFRDEFIKAGSLGLDLGALAATGAGEAGIPDNLDLSPLNSNTADIIFSTNFPIASTDRTLLNQLFSNQAVGPFNNPIEIKSGAISREFQRFELFSR
jgi:hypothetical protein